MLARSFDFYLQDGSKTVVQDGEMFSSYLMLALVGRNHSKSLFIRRFVTAFSVMFEFSARRRNTMQSVQ